MPFGGKHRGRGGSIPIVALRSLVLVLVVVTAACSSSGSEELTCGEYLSSGLPERDRLVRSGLVDRESRRAGEAFLVQNVDNACGTDLKRTLADILDTFAETNLDTTITTDLTTERHVLDVRPVLGRSPLAVISEQTASTAGQPDTAPQLPEDSCTSAASAEEVVDAVDEIVGVSDGDGTCFLLGPTRLRAMSLAAVEEESTDRGEMLRIRFHGDDAEILDALIEDALDRVPTIPTGQLAILLDGTLVMAPTIVGPVGGGINIAVSLLSEDAMAALAAMAE